MLIYDIHTHKHSQADADPCLRQIVSITPDQVETAFSLTEQNPLYSIGIHPWQLEDWENQLTILDRFVRFDRVVALGEVGLDKLCATDYQLQLAVFEAQLKIASIVQKPLIIHCVRAWDDLIRLYKKYVLPKRSAWIIHGFRGNPNQAKQLADLGFKISVGKNFNLLALRSIPDQSLFCETDNADCGISEVYDLVATTLQISRNMLGEQIEKNVNNTFFTYKK